MNGVLQKTKITILDGKIASLFKIAQGLTANSRIELRKTRANDYLAKKIKQDIDCHHEQLLNNNIVDSAEVLFLPQNRLLSIEEKEIIKQILPQIIESGQFTSGPYISMFEQSLEEYLEVKRVVATSSGTDAMMIALHALGLKPGDEVIMPANSFAATENAVLACGAYPVLVDVDENSYNIAPEQIESKISDATKVILPVHLYGKIADMKEIRLIAEKYGLKILEDACQAIGVDDVGKYSDGAVLSFNPYKNFGVCGKGGAIITNDLDFAERCRSISYHGFKPGVKNVKSFDFGFNSQIDNTQAAIGYTRLPFLAYNNLKRIILARGYNAALKNLEDKEIIKLPQYKEDNCWHLYPVRLLKHKREDIMKKLKEVYRIQTDIYYPVLTHRHHTNLVSSRYKNTELPVTENANGTLLTLPLYNNFTLNEQARVIEGVQEILQG